MSVFHSDYSPFPYHGRTVGDEAILQSLPAVLASVLNKAQFYQQVLPSCASLLASCDSLPCLQWPSIAGQPVGLLVQAFTHCVEADYHALAGVDSLIKASPSEQPLLSSSLMASQLAYFWLQIWANAIVDLHEMLQAAAETVSIEQVVASVKEQLIRCRVD